MPAFGPTVQSLATLTVLALVLGIGLALVLVVPSGRRGAAALTSAARRTLLGAAWLVVSLATAGSLYLSDVAGLVPCLLCWYQRIAMYPLVLLLGVATLVGDGRIWRYVLPLSLTGLAISVYHVTIQYRPTLGVVSCSAEAPCTARYLHVYGFVSIPVMAGAAFLLVSALVALAGLAPGPTAGEEQEEEGGRS
jgi:disulfide bond formation protein DsbB